jgi:SPP1 gp7 family putative phage head morphogenesis protein
MPTEAQRKRIKKQLSNRRKTRAFKEPPENRMIEMEFGKAIIKEINKIDEITKKVLLPELDRLTNHKTERFDTSLISKKEACDLIGIPFIKEIRLDVQFKELAGITLVAALIARMKSMFFGESVKPNTEPRQEIFTRSLNKTVKPFLNRVKEKTETQFVNEFERQTGTKPLPAQLNVDEFIQDSLQANISLIKTVPGQYFSQIEQITKDAVRKGELTATARAKIQELTGNAKNRARLIARDQIGKLTANIEEARQRKSGVTEYIWRTRQDGRVRSLANSDGYSDHKRLEGVIIKWNDPPVTVFKGKRAGERHHAGTDIQDRCWPQAIYDEITGVSHPDTVEARKKAA